MMLYQLLVQDSMLFVFPSRRRHTRFDCDWSSDVCSSDLGIFGLSPDGTLVWGRGVHNGVREGFVVEFASGYLATCTEPEVYSAPAATIGSGVVTFFSNGYYIIAETALPEDAPTGISGFERGQYKWDATTGAISFFTLVDTGGDYGLS